MKEEKKEAGNYNSSHKSEDSLSVATGASSGPVTRSKAKQIEKDQQI